MSVNGSSNPNGVCRKFHVLSVNDLRDADRLFFNLLCDIKAVACTGEIEYHVISLF